MTKTLAIVGASARAAAFSAVRAGHSVCAIDLFADADLRRVCQATQIRDYPRGFVDALREEQVDAWLYTGAIENYPSLVSELSRLQPLWGNHDSVLRQVRDPRLVAKALGRHDLSTPALAIPPDTPSCGGAWLRKPRHSAGGAGITTWRQATPTDSASGQYYYQQFIDGRPCSAVYFAADGHAALWGVTWQLIGQAWCGTSGFHYCGSIGPVDLPARARGEFARIGGALAAEFELRGLFGVDAVVNSQGVWPVEINPRYPASAEILERAGLGSAMELHAAACQYGKLPNQREGCSKLLCGKAILFADSSRRINGEWTKRVLAQAATRRPAFGDIPRAGTLVDAGRPIATVFADGEDAPSVLDALRRLAAEVQSTTTT